MKPDKWLAIVNVFAASKKAGSVWKRAAACLETAGVAYKAEFTGGKYNAAELGRKAAERGYRKFIAVGGDGTIHDVLNGIAEYAMSDDEVNLSDFTLSVIPVGSGNDWVKSIGLSADIHQAVASIAAGVTGIQDVVKVSVLDDSDFSAEPLAVSYMSNIGGVGLDARVCEIVNRKKERGRRGKKLYVSALLYCIRHRVPIRAKVICDGQTIFSGRYLSMAFGVGKYSGGGMRQTPEAVLDDGLLDITIIPDIPIWTIAKEVYKLFTGNFLTIKEVIPAKCREVFILPESEADAEPVEVDGEVVGRAPVKMEVLEQQINIIKPV
ncbi:MAG: YegS/Rv2252/BmrU family lipid kinase [Bacteroidales bacterium]|nr:YegS/Rv2252/BmrU family lipid kinase [Bacteroidales bacterium]